MFLNIVPMLAGHGCACNEKFGYSYNVHAC